jgi:hypothetical protein
MATLIRRLAFCLITLALGATVAHAQAAGAWSGCRADSLSIWNCAQYYSGTVSSASDLKGTDLHITMSVVATITAGKVSCHLKGSEIGEYTGPGMIAVEHSSTENTGKYTIKLWCPGAEGERVTRDDSPIIEVLDQQSADYRALSGTESYPHPDSDDANGLKGTYTSSWRLQR